MDISKEFLRLAVPDRRRVGIFWRFGRKVFHRNFRLPRALDIPLRGIKYILTVLFVYVVADMSVVGIRQFLDSSYGMVDDVKMLNLFRELGMTGGNARFGQRPIALLCSFPASWTGN